ncbi:MAG TPA: adenylate/guanylate cyclase domain-containing protein [Stellaceae bacterium]|nr:adenylate/guanylate cyclase domain-containing protein [Stellaceae bacterium]
MIVLAGGLAAAASLALGPAMSPVDGLLYDVSLNLTAKRPGTAGEPVAVVALDEESLGSPELAAMPRALFAPVWAKLVDGLTKSGAKAIGFDIIFAYSANRLSGVDAAHDQSFLASLHRARDRVVLARTARMPPAFPYIAAVFDPGADAGKKDPGAVAYVELDPDADGVQRRVQASLRTSEGDALPSIAATLLARAGRAAMPAEVLLAPARPLEAIPSYRLIDVLRCLDRDPDALRAAFAGKVVLIGTTLPDEDRKRTPDRFMSPSVPVAVPVADAASGGCNLARLGPSDWSSRTVPGVFAHAGAIEEVLTGDLIRPLPRGPRALVAGLGGALGVVFGFALSPWLAAGAAAMLGLALFATALLALPLGFWIPAALPAGAGAGGMVLAYLARFVVEDRRRRRIQRAFGHYLAPVIVDRLAENDTELRLGGERRDVTVMFADLSGFTALSGRLGPEELTRLTNDYLGLLVREVEATNGYVDKFIGDAVMAVWGAPHADPDHAAHAAQAALAGLASVNQAKAEADRNGLPGYSVKMGLNSGPAVIGNVGAPGRYNYTAIGETVNIAARLEGIPHDYNCAIVVGPATAAAVAGRYLVCELDWVQVKGKAEPIAIYELLAPRLAEDQPELRYCRDYAEALASYRRGDFPAAEAAWRRMRHPRPSSEPSTPPEIMADRCAYLRADPPREWTGVFVKTTK